MASNSNSAEEKGSNVAKHFNVLRGAGPSSRISLDFDKLRNAGWVITERTDGLNKIHFKYVTPELKTLKSAKDVERKLREQGVLEQFLKEDELHSINKREIDSRQPSSSRSILQDIDPVDPDYEPPPRKEMKMSQAEDTKKW